MKQKRELSFFKNDLTGYLKDFPKLNEIIRELVEEAGKDLHDYQYGCREAEEIECQSRDGFIPSEANRGGWEYTDYTDVNGVNGSGLFFASAEATKRAKKDYDNAFKECMKQLGMKRFPKSEKKREELYEAVTEYLRDETIMLNVRVMYHGVDAKGVHVASVSGCVNWEAPYHRTSGAVYRNTGYRMITEDAHEIEIEFKTEKQLRVRLTKALNEVKAKLF
jgi:hypothetical protein